MGCQAPSWPRRGGSLVAGVMMECPRLTENWPGQGWADALSWNQSIGIYWTSKTQWANYWIYLLRLYFYAGIKSYSWSMMCTYPHLYNRYSPPWLPNAPSYAVSRSRPSDSPSASVLLLHWLQQLWNVDIQIHRWYSILLRVLKDISK